MKICTCGLCQAREYAAALAKKGYGWEDIEIKTGLPAEACRIIVGLKPKGLNSHQRKAIMKQHEKKMELA